MIILSSIGNATMANEQHNKPIGWYVPVLHWCTLKFNMNYNKTIIMDFGMHFFNLNTGNYKNMFTKKIRSWRKSVQV